MPSAAFLRSAQRCIKLIWYDIEVAYRLSGTFRRECPICSCKRYFRSYGVPPRYDAKCPKCDSLERHRQLKLWLDRNPDAVNRATSVLHFAPESAVRAVVEQQCGRYVTADIEPGRADLVLDIEELALPDRSFGAIICSHILEHVDDRKALAEMFRVLEPGGFALLMTPAVWSWSQTYENPAIHSPRDRQLHFGQKDHVRYFGADIRDCIKAAGFETEEFTAVEPDVTRYSLERGHILFIARRPE